MPDYKNYFTAPGFIQETIVNKAGKTIGTIRIKPNNILWKPSGQQKYYAVELDMFTTWITNSDTRARRTGS